MNALISRLQAPRTIRSHVARLLVVRTIGSALLIATAFIGQSLVVQPSGAELEALPSTTTVWTQADQAKYPGCMAADLWPANTWGSAVVAYSPERGTTSRVGFDRAWEATHNADPDRRPDGARHLPLSVTDETLYLVEH